MEGKKTQPHPVRVCVSRFSALQRSDVLKN